VVATPIGNLEDISQRAARVLAEVDLILAEDTRHSRRLLAHLGIRTPVQSCHDHNEQRVQREILERLRSGENLALISDAGTPLISDPGFITVRAVREQGISVVPIPGPSAVITALAAAGLPAEKFRFCGFAPARQSARLRLLESLRDETATLVFYEAPRRVLAFLEDALSVFGPGRPAVIGRELTKKFESFYQGGLDLLLDTFRADPDSLQGEFVILVQGAQSPPSGTGTEPERILAILLRHGLALSEAVAIATEITGAKKNDLYRLALALTSDQRCGPEPGADGK